MQSMCADQTITVANILSGTCLERGSKSEPSTVKAFFTTYVDTFYPSKALLV